MRIFLVRRAGELVGVLPMIERRDCLASAANEHIPEFGLLADGAEVADRLASVLFGDEPKRVSVINLRPPDESFRALLHAAHHRRYRIVLRHYRCSPYLDLTGSWEEYESRLSKKLRKTLRGKDRRLRQKGTVSFDVVE